VSHRQSSLGRVVLAISLATSLTATSLLAMDAFGGHLTVRRDGPERAFPPFVWGVNLPAGYVTKANLYDSNGGLGRLRALGIRQLRFPNGCEAEIYQWRGTSVFGGDPAPRLSNRDASINQAAMSIDTALEVASEVGADLLYTVNTETLALPSPCGYVPTYPGRDEATNQHVLVEDAKEIVRRYGSRVRRYELGNEPWGFWQPAKYFEVALTFARAMKAVNPAIEIGVAGAPTTGNNQANGAVDPRFALWTQIARARLGDTSCGGRRCFDFITDHQYSYVGYNPGVQNPANFPGMGAYFPTLNLAPMVDRRRADYGTTPLAHTEWNIQCWQYGLPVWNTVEHGLFTGEALALMADRGVAMAHYHTLAPTHPGAGCGLSVHGTASPNPQGQAFELTAALAGALRLRATVTASQRLDPLPTDPNRTKCEFAGCLQGTSAEYVSEYAGSRPASPDLVLLLFNRHPSKAASLSTDFADYGLGGFRSMTTTVLAGSSFTARAFSGPATSVLTDLGPDPIFELPPMSVTRVVLLRRGGAGYWNFDGQQSMTSSDMALDGVARYASGPCSGQPAGECRFDTRTFLPVGNRQVESITAGSRYWNFWADDGSPWWGNGNDLTSVPRYASGPCAGLGSGQCRFDTRTFANFGGRWVESITVGSRYWNFWADNGSPWWGNGNDLTSVGRYASGPCAGSGPGQCRFDTRTFVVLGGRLVESITAGSRYWNFWADNGSPWWGNGSDLLGTPRYAAGPCLGRTWGQCSFGTRTFVPIGGRLWESITR